MMRLFYFPQKHEYAFVVDSSTLKPVPVGPNREEWFVSKDDAKDAARESGYWIQDDVAREH